MAELTETLFDGLRVGDQVHTEVVLREPTAAEILAASRASEVLVATEDGPVLVLSPALMGAEVLKRQVVRIGELPGPLDDAQFGRLSGRDLSVLQAGTARLEKASLEAMKRGRASGDGATDTTDGGADRPDHGMDPH